MAIFDCKFTFFLNQSGAFNLIFYLLQLRAFLRDYIDECSQTKARRTRKRVHDAQPAVGEEEAPINAPKWATAGYKGSLKSKIEKYTRRAISSSPDLTALVPAGPVTAPSGEESSRSDPVITTTALVPAGPVTPTTALAPAGPVNSSSEESSSNEDDNNKKDDDDDEEDSSEEEDNSEEDSSKKDSSKKDSSKEDSSSEDEGNLRRELKKKYKGGDKDEEE